MTGEYIDSPARKFAVRSAVGWKCEGAFLRGPLCRFKANYSGQVNDVGVGQLAWTKFLLLFALSKAFFTASWCSRSGLPLSTRLFAHNVELASVITAFTVANPAAFALVV